MINDMYILNEKNEVIPAPSGTTWAGWFRDVKRRRVAYDELEGALVSTVFLGLDHSFGGKGPPIVFETAVFIDGSDCEIKARYSTWDDAEKGHRETVASIRRGRLKVNKLNGEN